MARASAAQQRMSAALAWLSSPNVTLTAEGQFRAAELAKRLSRPYRITDGLKDSRPSTAARVRAVESCVTYNVGGCYAYVPEDGRVRVKCPDCSRIIFMGEWFTHPCSDKQWKPGTEEMVWVAHCPTAKGSWGVAGSKHVYAATSPDLLPETCPCCDTHPIMLKGLPESHQRNVENLKDAHENLWALRFPSAVSFESTEARAA